MRWKNKSVIAVPLHSGVFVGLVSRTQVRAMFVYILVVLFVEGMASSRTSERLPMTNSHLILGSWRAVIITALRYVIPDSVPIAHCCPKKLLLAHADLALSLSLGSRVWILLPHAQMSAIR